SAGPGLGGGRGRSGAGRRDRARSRWRSGGQSHPCPRGAGFALDPSKLQRAPRAWARLTVSSRRCLTGPAVKCRGAFLVALAGSDEREPGIAHVARSDDELVVRALGDQPDPVDILVLDDVAVSAIVGRTAGDDDVTEHQRTIELVPEAQRGGEHLPAPLQA